MRPSLRLLTLTALVAVPALAQSPNPLLGLPPVPVPADNPQTPEKEALGHKLFRDKRFSANGEVACETCHDRGKAFTDSPLPVSEGLGKAKGTRNAPTVLNAAFNETQFWDGREPSLERQSTQPFLNPIEMGLPSHEPILKVVRSDAEYQPLFKSAFGVSGGAITMDHVTKALAAFERAQVSGGSPFDRWYFGGEEKAVSDAVKRGFTVFLQQGRCVSCHTVSQTSALFTDGHFHNINVGFPRIEKDVVEMATAFSTAKKKGENVDVAVLANKNTSDLGRFAVDDRWAALGSFKTPTLRNIELTAPYMHDGSLKTLEEVVEHYSNGGKLKETDPEPSGFLSGGIRPLNLTADQKKDLVAFLKSLTSPQVAAAMTKSK
ncbi:MAG: c-type cytochrome [Myxococcaceae bacterium]|nr:c-type cytochrome [Myxococcaceae bacterium]